VLWLQTTFNLTYARAWYLYIPFFLITASAFAVISGVDLINYFLNSSAILVGLLSIGLFIGLEFLRGYSWTFHEYFRAETLPVAYRDLFQPRLSGITVKTSEIFFQDVIALVLVLALFNQFSLLVTSTIFVCLVALLHIPGLWLYGRIYGGMFLFYSTILAATVPWLLTTPLLGFVLIFSLHLLMYPVMMGVMYLMGRCYKN